MKWLLVAIGGYLLYEYLYPSTATGVTPATAAIPPLTVTTLQPGTTGSGSTPTSQVPVAPVSAQPQVSSTLSNQLLQAAANSGLPGLNTDEWLYYFTQITGMPVTGLQTETVLQTLGLSDATRATIVPFASFIAALHQMGLGRLHLVN